MEETTKVEPKKEEVKQHTAEDFVRKYEELCKELGFRVVVSPSWVARDDGTFSMQLQYTVGALPKIENTQ